MKNQTGSRTLLLLSSALICVIVGLLAFLYWDFRGDQLAAESRRMTAETELYRAAENLAEDLEEGSFLYAYHDAREAAESARETGQEGTARFFERIALSLSEGELPAGETVRTFLETGESVGNEPPAIVLEEEEGDEPRILSEIRLDRARRCARRLIGAGASLRLSEKSREGQLVFTCANAYAVIDETSGLPLEASLSLAPGEPKLTADECAARAQSFLAEFYPPDFASAAILCRLAPADQGQVMRAVFYSRGRQISVDIRRDTGRVVGLRT